MIDWWSFFDCLLIMLMTCKIAPSHHVAMYVLTVHTSHSSFNRADNFNNNETYQPLLFNVWDMSDGPSQQQQRQSSSHQGSIGLVYIDLNPLLMRTANLEGDDDGGGDGSNSKGESTKGAGMNGVMEPADVEGGDNQQRNNAANSSVVIDGWFPLYDTLGGVRGELGLSVKLNFIGDKNPFRDSSAGVRIFPHSNLDPRSGYTVAHVFGFVKELVVADDPEFEWSDNFNQSRTSHETRQTLMYLLDAKVRRRMCRRVLEMGGNAVLAYRQSFDMEGDSGLVARTYGTCVLIQRKEMVQLINNPTAIGPASGNEHHHHHHHDEHSPHKELSRSSTGMMMAMINEATAAAQRQRDGAQEEVQLLTMNDFGPRVRVRIGGLVTAVSAKHAFRVAASFGCDTAYLLTKSVGTCTTISLPALGEVSGKVGIEVFGSRNSRRLVERASR